MSQVILLNESTASNRIVYIWSVLSNGTSPAQFEAGGQPTMSVAGLTKWNSAGTLLAVDTTNGEYQIRLGTSDVSVLGPGVIRYSSSSALETSIPFQIVAYNPYDATKLGLTSVSTFDSSVLSVTVSAMNKSVGATSGLSFTPAPGDYSSVVTVGVGNIVKTVGAISGLSFLPAPGTYSSVSVSVSAVDKAVGATSGLSFQPVPGDYSSTVTVGVSKIKAGTYSAVTIDGVGSPVTVGAIVAGTYSGVTVGSLATLVSADYSSKVTMGVGSIKGGDYSNVTISGLDSGVTIATGGIIAASFGAGAVDATALASSGENAIADALIARNIAGGSSTGRTVGQAFAALRNKVAIDGSTVTVYGTDDTTASWVASLTTTSVNSGLISSVDPA